MYICTYENIHICVYAHMIERAYDNGSGCVLERLFGAQPVAQSRTPVQNAIAAGLRRRAVENQPPNAKKPAVRLSLTDSGFFAVGGWELTARLAGIPRRPIMVPQLWRPAFAVLGMRFNSVVLSYSLPHFLN
jgi:hypothetical protein